MFALSRRQVANKKQFLLFLAWPFFVCINKEIFLISFHSFLTRVKNSVETLSFFTHCLFLFFSPVTRFDSSNGFLEFAGNGPMGATRMMCIPNL